jgi:hypothetical protein
MVSINIPLAEMFRATASTWAKSSVSTLTGKTLLKRMLVR